MTKESQFSSIFIKYLSKVLKMKKMLLIAYYSQTYSQTEKINQEAKVFLQYYINYQQDD